MDIIGSLCVSLDSSTFQIHDRLVSNAYAHVQRLVFGVKVVTVLEDSTTEEQRFLCVFCGQKDSLQMIFVKKCFLFTGGSVCRVKRFTAEY
jgi:hypothetical protein